MLWAQSFWITPSCFVSFWCGASGIRLGGRIRGTLGGLDTLNKVPFDFKRAIRQGSEGSPFRGLPNIT